MVANFPKADELVESSQKYAQSALRTYGTDQHERFPFYSVTAIEHLAKACLLKKNPVLLVELRDSPINEASLLALARVKPFDSDRLRTIGVERALERLRNLAVVSGNRAELSLLIDLRNGHTHLAQNAAEDEDLLLAFITQTEAILADLSVEPSAFWMDMVEFVATTKEQGIEKVTRTVRRKIVQSEAIFAEKISGMSAEIVAQLREDPPALLDLEDSVRCPVCSSWGASTGENQMAYDEEDGVVSMWVEFWAENFRCPNCLLVLKSESEMEAAGMETVIVSDRDPGDYFEYDVGDDD